MRPFHIEWAGLRADASEGLRVLIPAALCTIALFASGAGGWRGAPDSCLVNGQCFCERDRGGLVRQPANTASNAAYVAVGVAIAVRAGRDRRKTPRSLPRNPMTGTRFAPLFYAGLVALLGPGSMALHASLTRWGSVLDLLSMNVVVSFLFLYAWQRWRGLTPARFVAAYLGINAVLLAIKLVHGHGSGAFAVLAIATIAIELAIRKTRPLRADSRYLGWAIGLFASGFAIWLLSQNDGLLCDPDSLLQGHAVWHILGAATAGALYLYARSERTETSAS